MDRILSDLMKMALALALFDGVDFVTPGQIQSLPMPVNSHRLVQEPQAPFFLCDRTWHYRGGRLEIKGASMKGTNVIF
jgi:hypothetical protein